MTEPEPLPLALARGAPLQRDADAPPNLAQALAARIREDTPGRVVAWRPDAAPHASSHVELWDRASRLAAGLLGLDGCEGRVVVLLLPNVLDFVPAFWACLRVGAIPLPFGASARSRSRLALLGERLATFGHPLILVEEPSCLPDFSEPPWTGARLLPLAALEAASPCEVTEPALTSGILMPTSGSTGQLKLAWLSHRVLLNRSLTRRLRPETTAGVAVSPFPNDGVSGVGAAFLGYREWVQTPPEALATRPLALLEAVEDCRGNYLFLSSSMAQQILAAARAAPRAWDLASLRWVLVGAEPVVAEVMRELAAFLAGHGAESCRIWAGYGTTETGPLVEGADPTAWTEADRGLLGPPLPGVSLRIVDASGAVLSEGAEGEIEVACPDKLFTGYWGELGQTGMTPDGWWRTGDLGCLQEGRLLVRGRHKEVFIHQGRKLALGDIDVHLQEALGAEVRAISVVLPEAGGVPERLAMALAPLRPGAAPTDAATTIQATLARHCGARAAWIETLAPDQIPLTESGKPQRADLARRLADASARAAAVPAVPPEGGAASVDAIWRELLGDEAVRQPQATFFEMGGESLQSALLFSLIQERLGQSVPVEAFFAKPTLDRLKELVAAQAPDLQAGTSTTADSPWPLPRELHQGLLSYLETWVGVRPTRDRLVVGWNVMGTRPPLFWCFQEAREFSQLARHLGPEQPLYGFRSGHLLIDYAEDTLQNLVLCYLHEILEVCPSGPLFLGGTCQGGVIILAVAQHLFRRRRRVPLLALVEWAFPLQVYPGSVLLLHGRDSPEGNPWLRHRQPERGWGRYFREYWIEEIPGPHGHLSDDGHIEILAGHVSRYLDQTLAQVVWQIPRDGYPPILTAIDLPARLTPGERTELEIQVRNQADYAWGSAASEVWLGNYWMDAQDTIVIRLDGRTECPELRPGDNVTLPLTITAPLEAGSYRLVVDLVEEGSHWLDPHRRQALVASVEVA